MGILTFVIDPDAAIPLTGDQIVTKINDDTILVIDRAESVDAAARPLVADEVTATEIATDAVGADEIQSGAVNTDELATGAVTGVKLADDSVTGARARATGILDLSDQPIDTETVTIGVKVYTFQDSLTEADGNVLIGASASDSLDNLIAAINLDAGAGVQYANAMTINPDVTAAPGALDTMDVAAKKGGTPGNSVATTETLTTGEWTSGATLTGGTNGKMVQGAAKDDLDSESFEDRKYIKTNPQVGEFRIVGVQRDASGDLDVEYDDQAVT